MPTVRRTHSFNFSSAAECWLGWHGRPGARVSVKGHYPERPSRKVGGAHALPISGPGFCTALQSENPCVPEIGARAVTLLPAE